MLAVEQNNYVTKIVNGYIFYDWQKIPVNNFKLKNCLFRATNIAKTGNKSSCLCSGYEKEFDDSGSWSFGKDFCRNVVIFSVANSSPSHANNCKNKFFVLGDQLMILMAMLVQQRKSLVLILVKQSQNVV